MRSNEERVAEVKRRIAEKERQKKPCVAGAIPATHGLFISQWRCW